MTALLLLMVAVCALLPAAELAAAFPAIWILQNSLLSEQAVLFNAGPLHVAVTDLLMLPLFARFAFSVVRTREIVAHRSLYFAIAIFVVVNALATLAAGVKFSGSQMVHGLTALSRLCLEIALVPILAQTVRSLPQARRCVNILFVTLGVLAAIQFINFFGASHGVVIGEVQGIERGEERYFGPVGDSIGVVLLLGYVCSLCFANVAGIMAFAGGIVLTAGLGAVFSAGIGTALFLVFGARAAQTRAAFARWYWLLPALAFAALAAVMLVGKPLSRTLLERLNGGGYSHSADQRVASATLARAMIVDNPLGGVGYMGYEPALARYGGGRFFDLSHSDGATANANNQILQSLTDAGLPGLLAFAGLVIAATLLLRNLAVRCDDRFLATYFRGAFIWLLAQVFGNLAAVWLIPSAYVARLLWITLGIAVAVAKLLPSPVTPPAFEREAGLAESPLVSV